MARKNDNAKKGKGHWKKNAGKPKTQQKKTDKKNDGQKDK